MVKSSCDHSLHERDIWLPVRGLSQMVPTARSERPESDEKGDRSEFGSMGANEKDRRSDKQRPSRSRRGTTVLHARRPPRDVRMSRVLSVPETRNLVSEACRSFYRTLPPSSYPSESGTPTSTPVVDVCPGARCSTTTEHRASFVVIRTLTLLKLSSISISSDISIVCVCVRVRVRVRVPVRACGIKEMFVHLKCVFIFSNSTHQCMDQYIVHSSVTSKTTHNLSHIDITTMIQTQYNNVHKID